MAINWYKQIVISILLGPVLYFGVVKKYNYKISYDFTLEGVEPREAWEYFSNFENIKKMNPTIKSYEILSGTGNFKSKKYSVLYQEISTLLQAKSEITGHYEVLPVSKDGEPYRIFSAHDSCQLGFCLYGTDKTYFKKGYKEKTTRVIQEFEYECQFLFSYLCEAEFMAQHEVINDNMKTAHKARPRITR